MTIVLREEGSDDIAEAVIEASRKNYAKEYAPKKKKIAKTDTTKATQQSAQDKQNDPSDESSALEALPSVTP